MEIQTDVTVRRENGAFRLTGDGKDLLIHSRSFGGLWKMAKETGRVPGAGNALKSVENFLYREGITVRLKRSRIGVFGRHVHPWIRWMVGRRLAGGKA